MNDLMTGYDIALHKRSLRGRSVQIPGGRGTTSVMRIIVIDNL